MNKVLQVSGLKYTWKNNEVDDIFLEDGITPIDPFADYTVAVNSFLASGGDGFTVFEKGISQKSESVDFESLIEYLEQFQRPFSASIEGRIIKL